MAKIIAAGNSDTLEAELLLNGEPVAIPEGATWEFSSEDPLVTFSPVNDQTTGEPIVGETAATIGGSETQTEVVIKASTTDPNGNVVSGSITIPVTPAPQVFTVRITEVEAPVADQTA